MYDTVLPKLPSDSTSITYTISSEDPPRSTETFQEIPIAEEIKERPKQEFTRDALGELVFTVTQAAQTITGSAKKTFEVGQLLDFSQDVVAAPTTTSPSYVEIRHDTNRLDLSSVGLSSAEVVELVAASELREAELEKRLTELIEQTADIEVRIVENQKNINEVQKTLDAAETAITETGSIIVDKLRAKLQQLEGESRRYLTSCRRMIP